jgi:outer membrane protein assembly factor BamA
MVLCKINKNITKIIILLPFVLFFFSCNVTKHLKDSEKLLVENKIKLEDRKDIKKDAELNIYTINQIIKPNPNTKIIGIPISLKMYYLIDVKKRENFVEEKNTKCNERKNLKINKIGYKIKKTDRKKSVDSTHYSPNSRINRKISELENKKQKINQKKCDRYKWIKNLGENPVPYQINDEYKNKRKLNILLKNYGYYNSKIIITSKARKHNDKKMVVTYQINPGKPHLIDHINYNIEDRILSDLIIADSTNSKIKPGKRFDYNLIESERERISEYLKNKGYYKFTQEFIFFSIDTIGKQYLADITITITNPKDEYNEFFNHKKYYIHEVYIYPDFKPSLALKERENYFLKTDTILFYSKKNQKYNFIYNDIPNVNPQAIARNLYVAPDKLFNLNDINSSYRYLASLPLITITNIQIFERGNISNSNDTVPNYIDCEIRLTQDSIQSYEIAAEVTNTIGDIGIQSSIRYKNNNMFRNADIFDLKLNFAIKRATKLPYDTVETAGFNGFEYGLDIGLNFPRLLAPVPLKKFIKRSNPKTVFNIKYNKLIEPGYSTSVAGISFGYFWYSTNTIYNDFRPITGDFVKLINPTDRFMVWAEANNLIENYKSRFIFGSAYRFSFNNQMYSYKNDFFNISVYLKLIGNTLYAFNKWTDAQKVDSSYVVAGNSFAQFVKTDFDLRYYRKLNRKNDKFVFRLFNGIAYPYGNLNVVPFSEQYFSGGANGIRAWQERSLGPGTYNPEDTLLINKADIKLEGNFEYRMNLFGQLEGAIFIDAGNIWAINKQDQREGALFETKDFYKEIAVGSGFGLRYDLTIMVLRLDFGIKVVDPARPINRRLIRFHEYGHNEFILNFGIGYPF